MAYIAKNLSMLQGSIGGSARLWTYWTSDTVATILGAGYISDATNKRMQIGDIVLIFTGTLNTTGADQSPATHARGTVSEFASDPTFGWFVCDAISSGAATLLEVVAESGSTVGFFGVTPVARQTATAQSAVATTTITNIGSTSLTATDVTSLNALISRVEAIRVLQAQTRSDLIAYGLQKGSA